MQKKNQLKKLQLKLVSCFHRKNFFIAVLQITLDYLID